MTTEARKMAFEAADLLHRLVTVELEDGDGIATRVLTDAERGDPDLLAFTLELAVGTSALLLARISKLVEKEPADVWRDWCLTWAKVERP